MAAYFKKYMKKNTGIERIIAILEMYYHSEIGKQAQRNEVRWNRMEVVLVLFCVVFICVCVCDEHNAQSARPLRAQ